MRIVNQLSLMSLTISDSSDLGRPAAIFSAVGRELWASNLNALNTFLLYFKILKYLQGVNY